MFDSKIPPPLSPLSIKKLPISCLTNTNAIELLETLHPRLSGDSTKLIVKTINQKSIVKGVVLLELRIS